ncbi:hypothetical protein F5Y02DRAFT_330309 [Annulohypoxylon stygium]|nr:hypothetical protein F5Y02DRAFT_330309 [Annulohypoxylon stygium]
MYMIRFFIPLNSAQWLGLLYADPAASKYQYRGATVFLIIPAGTISEFEWLKIPTPSFHLSIFSRWPPIHPQIPRCLFSLCVCVACGVSGLCLPGLSGFPLSTYYLILLHTYIICYIHYVYTSIPIIMYTS